NAIRKQRGDRYVVDAGTSGERFYYNRTPPEIQYLETGGQPPYFTRSSNETSSHTLGLKYQPVQELTARVSQSTAFLPPSANQLNRNPLTYFDQSGGYYPLNEPGTNLPISADVLFGGNPDLRPQNSRTFNAGLIWSPGWRRAPDMRFNVEYYRTTQRDAIGFL